MASSLNGTGVTLSNGSTQAVAWPGNTGTVTSVATGNGLTGGTITTTGTISLDVYTGSTATYTTYPIGTCIWVARFSCAPTVALNQTISVYINNSLANFGQFSDVNIGGTGAASLAGTWKHRGGTGGVNGSGVAQRVA
jgi:hypothetical protein